MPVPRVLFLTLSTFSTTGGIEKVCRIAAKALTELADKRKGSFKILSMYDKNVDVMQQYVSPHAFAGYSSQRMRFVKDAISQGRGSSHVILSHINLLLVGFFIKLLAPNTKVFLIAHGIEVWVKLPYWKKLMLKKLDKVLAVSEYTRQRMIALYDLPPQKLTVLNNCLDPFLQKTANEAGVADVREKYGLLKGEKILFTLARLSHSEQYKGYDKVIQILPQLIQTVPRLKYLIAGKYDRDEKERLAILIEQLDVKNHVVFTGFVLDEEVEALFTCADIYIMPSTGEGFGVVFIEALFYGLPVIAGNRDGSVDALAGGQLGQLIDPNNPVEIIRAVKGILDGGAEQKLPLQNEVFFRFGFPAYKTRLAQAISLC